MSGLSWRPLWRLERSVCSSEILRQNDLLECNVSRLVSWIPSRHSQIAGRQLSGSAFIRIFQAPNVTPGFLQRCLGRAFSNAAFGFLASVATDTGVGTAAAPSLSREPIHRDPDASCSLSGSLSLSASLVALSGSKRRCALDRCSLEHLNVFPATKAAQRIRTRDIYVVSFDQIVARLFESHRGFGIPQRTQEAYAFATNSDAGMLLLRCFGR